jgi:hypothetical protein
METMMSIAKGSKGQDCRHGVGQGKAARNRHECSHWQEQTTPDVSIGDSPQSELLSLLSVRTMIGLSLELPPEAARSAAYEAFDAITS